MSSSSRKRCRRSRRGHTDQISLASSRDDAQAGDTLEVPDIASSDTEAKLQSSGRYQQILESNAQSVFSLLAFDAASKLGRVDRYRVNGHVANELINESLSAMPLIFQLGALDSVGQLNDGHHRKADLDFSVSSFKVLQNLPHRASLAFTGTRRTGIEN